MVYLESWQVRFETKLSQVHQQKFIKTDEFTTWINKPSLRAFYLESIASESSLNYDSILRETESSFRYTVNIP